MSTPGDKLKAAVERLKAAQEAGRRAGEQVRADRDREPEQGRETRS